MTRAFFLGIDVRKMVFPNLKGARKEKVIKSLEKLKEHFDKRFNGQYKVVTNEIRYVVNLTDNTDGDVVSVAGTMDMLIIDKNGNKYIYDMKTKNYNPLTNKVKFEHHDKLAYGEQTNIYRLMQQALFPNTSGQINEHRLIWFEHTYPPYADHWSYSTDDSTKIITVTKPDGSKVQMSELSDNEWNSPKLNNDDIEKSLIELDKDDKNLKASKYTEDVFEEQAEQEVVVVDSEEQTDNTDDIDDMLDESLYDDDSSNYDFMDDDDMLNSKTEDTGEEYYTYVRSLDDIVNSLPLEVRNNFIDLANNGEMNFKC